MPEFYFYNQGRDLRSREAPWAGIKFCCARRLLWSKSTDCDHLLKKQSSCPTWIQGSSALTSFHSPGAFIIPALPSGLPPSSRCRCSSRITEHWPLVIGTGGPLLSVAFPLSLATRHFSPGVIQLVPQTTTHQLLSAWAWTLGTEPVEAPSGLDLTSPSLPWGVLWGMEILESQAAGALKVFWNQPVEPLSLPSAVHSLGGLNMMSTLCPVSQGSPHLYSSAQGHSLRSHKRILGIPATFCNL